MKMETAKGMKDYGPEEKALRNSITNALETIFNKYGYNPLETPIMEKWEVLSSKYTGGSEILKETYKLTDQGERELGLRYDMTVPLARYIAMNPTIKVPFKRYQIGPVFRDGPVKKGRLRQFYQADIDVIGTDSLKADAELLTIALEAFDKLGISVEVKVNNRELLNAMIEKAGITEDNRDDAILALDKLEKIGREDVLEEMKDRGINGESAKTLLEYTSSGIEEFQDTKGGKELLKLTNLVGDDRIKITPSLARGLTYYTGNVFEIFDTDNNIDSSLAAGGRYDDMIGNMVERNEEYPAVGISFGIEPIREILKGKTEMPGPAKVYVIPIGVEDEARQAAQTLREASINTDIDLMDRGVSKNLDYANYYKIPYCLLIGEQEVKEGKYTLKDMNSGDEKKLTMEEVVEKLR